MQLLSRVFLFCMDRFRVPLSVVSIIRLTLKYDWILVWCFSLIMITYEFDLSGGMSCGV